MPLIIKNYVKKCLLNPYSFYHIKSRGKSSLGLWHEDINTELKLKIESHWSEEVKSKETKSSNQKHYYVLPMFPYPSGNLHMGHVRVYTISDTIARFQKLCGNNVIHPMGWDSFGLPAENAAIQRNIQPSIWTKSNIEAMKTQLIRLGFNFDWDREISTCDPKYYKWTQYIFLKLFEKGLAYQNKASVNWDPVDKTVLADEQVDDTGHSWRSGAKVEKKQLTQWFIKTTKFAKELYDGLDSKHLDNWKDIINLQKHWIGECNGLAVNFQVNLGNKLKYINVWTSQPHKLLHGNFLLIHHDNVLIQDLLKQEDKKLTAFNPFTQNELPIIVTDDANYPEERDVYIACPSTDPEDLKLAKLFNVPLHNVSRIKNVNEEDQKVIQMATQKFNGYFVSSKLKDWLISRQRFWGTPIPIIHCKECGQVPVPYSDLPVELPNIDSNESALKSLSSRSDWINCKCPNCQKDAKRETDTMDTFVDSSWYYCRFLDPNNTENPFRKEIVSENLPVDLYIGGKEHAVLHLYYARFMNYFLNSIGWSDSKEPFKKLLVQGMVMGQTFKLKSSGKYLSPDHVEKNGKKYFEKETNEPVVVQWEKMSKSKNNGENPEKLLQTFGCDTTRLLILADVPPATSRHWSEATFPGVLNWQHRLWITLREFVNYRGDIDLCNKQNIDIEQFRNLELKLWESRNYFIANTTFHFKYSQKLSVGISRLQGLTNVLRNNIPDYVVAQSKQYEMSLASLIIMLAPIAPHFCSELWSGLLSAPRRLCEEPAIDWNDNVLNQRWPVVDPNYGLSFLCKVDGVDRCELKLKSEDLVNLSENMALNLMMKDENVSKRTKRGILKTKLELYPECRAIFNIFTDRSQSSEKIKHVQ